MKHIIFEGSGINGMAYVGVIRELENQNLTKGITHFAGASSGAFISTMMALGFNSIELEHILKTIGIDELVNTRYIKQLYNLCSDWGLHPREKMYDKLHTIFQKKHHPLITFSELYHETGHFLTIVVTDVANKKALYINNNNKPTTPIIDILVASLSVPLIFELDKRTYFVDGGLSDNYPIWIYNDLTLLEQEAYDQLRDLPIPKDTLGVKIVSLDNDKHIKSLFWYIVSMVTTMLSQLENNVIPAHYFERSIQIVEKYNTSFDFNMSNDVIDELIAYGIEKTKEYLLS